MKKSRLFRVVLTVLILILSFFNFTERKTVNAVESLLTAGQEINVTGVSGNLNDTNIIIRFSTSVNLDGTNNALLVGLTSSDGTILTDARFVGSATNVGVYDEDGVAVVFENTPETIGTKTYSNPYYTYEIETNDFEVKNGTKNVDKLVIVGQKGSLISTEISFCEDGPSYEDAKTITVSNLKKDDVLIGGITNISSNMNLTYDNIDHRPYYSLIFKFKYKSFHANQNQFHLTNYDNRWKSASSFILNNDNGKTVNFGKSTIDNNNVGSDNLNYTMSVGQTYDIEYGRIAMLDRGLFAGTYYVYLKINNVIIKDAEMGIPNEVLQGNTVFINSDGKNEIYDYDYTFETPKEISVSDLKLGGNYVGHSINVTGHTDLTYSNSDHSTHYSLKFKFKYEVVQAGDNQIHLSCTGRNGADQEYKWGGASSFILNNNSKVNVGKSTSEESHVGWNDISYSMSVGNIYDVEYGRIAIYKNEIFTNKYYIYLIIDGTLIKAVEYGVPQAVLEGNLVFLTAAGHNTFYDDSYIPSYSTAVENIESYMSLAFSFDRDGSTYSNVKCVLGVGIDKAISSIPEVSPYTYGIEVSTASKTSYYNNQTGDLINGALYYKIIDVGDIINNSSRAVDVFTVRAYLECAGIKYYSTASKSYSVSTLVDYYLEQNESGALDLTANQVSALQSLQNALNN